MTHREKLIYKCICHCNFNWPHGLTSGIIFYEGEKITVLEFMDMVNRVTK